MVSLQEKVIRSVILKLLTDGNHRTEIIALLDAKFFEEALDLLYQFKEMKAKSESSDWFKELALTLDKKISAVDSKKNVAYNSGLNIKTIFNTFGSSAAEVVETRSREHYEEVKEIIENAKKEGEVDISLEFRKDQDSVSFSFLESLLFLNSLAVRRSAIRGGFWSSVGKKVEAPLMLSLCHLYGVTQKNYYYRMENSENLREIDFYLKKENHIFNCEVKLMGRGNPESADAIHARDTDVFIADRLSNLNKTQLDEANVEWIALSDREGYTRFENVLETLNIKKGNKISISDAIDSAFTELNQQSKKK